MFSQVFRLPLFNNLSGASHKYFLNCVEWSSSFTLPKELTSFKFRCHFQTCRPTAAIGVGSGVDKGGRGPPLAALLWGRHYGLYCRL